MTNSTTYRINVGTPRFGTHGKACDFLEETGLSGVPKKIRGGSYSVRVGVFRTKVRKKAQGMQRRVHELSGRNVKIIPEHNNRRETGGKRR
jgi:hypothetical protein